jgi:hypothetical protein
MNITGRARNSVPDAPLARFCDGAASQFLYRCGTHTTDPGSDASLRSYNMTPERFTRSYSDYCQWHSNCMVLA